MMEGTLNDVILSWYQSPKLKGIIKYLESEGLIKMDVGGWVIWITHEGIKEVEKLRDNPQTSTERFPPYQTIYYIGGNYSETGRVMGDVFRDIHNATIINKSLVENSFNKVKRRKGFYSLLSAPFIYFCLWAPGIQSGHLVSCTTPLGRC